MSVEIIKGEARGFDRIKEEAFVEIERERDKLRAEVERWKKRYYDVADAVCAESKDCEDLCRQARDTRAEVARLKSESRLNVKTGLRICELLDETKAEVERLNAEKSELLAIIGNPTMKGDE